MPQPAHHPNRACLAEFALGPAYSVTCADGCPVAVPPALPPLALCGGMSDFTDFTSEFCRLRREEAPGDPRFSLQHEVHHVYMCVCVTLGLVRASARMSERHTGRRFAPETLRSGDSRVHSRPGAAACTEFSRLIARRMPKGQWSKAALKEHYAAQADYEALLSSASAASSAA